MLVYSRLWCLLWADIKMQMTIAQLVYDNELFFHTDEEIHDKVFLHPSHLYNSCSIWIVNGDLESDGWLYSHWCLEYGTSPTRKTSFETQSSCPLSTFNERVCSASLSVVFWRRSNIQLGSIPLWPPPRTYLQSLDRPLYLSLTNLLGMIPLVSMLGHPMNLSNHPLTSHIVIAFIETHLALLDRSTTQSCLCHLWVQNHAITSI